MYNSKHYIPILKWKRAEYRALKDLQEKDKEKITPFIELVLPTVSPYKDKKKKIKKSQEEMLREMVIDFKEKRTIEIPKEILESWGKRPLFVDFTLLYDLQSPTQLKIESLNKILSIGADLGLRIIPVLNLNDDSELKKAVSLSCRKYGQGICLRITPPDFSGSENLEILNNKIQFFLSSLDLQEKNVDLLVDVKEKSHQYSKYINATQNTEKIMNWRNFIFASGAFPENLNKCKLDEPTHLPRLDWQNWLQHTEDKKLKRNPIFADYAIRNPIFKESLQYFSSTTSIKYAFKNDWIIMKGKKLDFPLYLANAKLLVEDSKYFYGESFSSGDKYIAQKAKHYYEYIKKPSIKGTGRSEDWIAAGISHHMALVISQIANLL